MSGKTGPVPLATILEEEEDSEIVLAEDNKQSVSIVQAEDDKEPACVVLPGGENKPVSGVIPDVIRWSGEFVCESLPGGDKPVSEVVSYTMCSEEHRVFET